MRLVSDMAWTLTPKHEVLSERAATMQLNRLGLSREELPLIAYRDAALQQLIEDGTEIKLDDVIRITRKSKTVGEAYYYRRVVA